MTAVDAPRAGDAWERRRVQMSLRIERAGLALLRERGLDDVTVDQIAAEAGISTRTFFRYFRNPRDILTAVPRRESRRMCAALLARPADESLLDGFHAWFRELGGAAATRRTRPASSRPRRSRSGARSCGTPPTSSSRRAAR